ncbi:hypothetical protein BGY98DRAFT_1175826 [Russula aff. rugulosa BPL654]|nr:hypothetical protein BGY98DRAFT_1175826 [Russula aff. rugulosa BPL654]
MSGREENAPTYLVEEAYLCSWDSLCIVPWLILSVDEVEGVRQDMLGEQGIMGAVDQRERKYAKVKGLGARLARLAPDQVALFPNPMLVAGSFSCIFFFLIMSVAKLVVPIYPFSMSHEDHPHKASYASQDAAELEVDHFAFAPQVVGMPRDSLSLGKTIVLYQAQRQVLFRLFRPRMHRHEHDADARSKIRSVSRMAREILTTILFFLWLTNPLHSSVIVSIYPFYCFEMLAIEVGTASRLDVRYLKNKLTPFVIILKVDRGEGDDSVMLSTLVTANKLRTAVSDICSLRYMIPS